MNTTQQLADMAFNILGPILAALGALLAAKLVSAFEKKTKIDVAQKTERQIIDWVLQGIALAEEKARKAVKQKVSPVTGPEKLEIASSHVLELIKKYKLDQKLGEWSRQKVQDIVHAELPMVRHDQGLRAVP